MSRIPWYETENQAAVCSNEISILFIVSSLHFKKQFYFIVKPQLSLVLHSEGPQLCSHGSVSFSVACAGPGVPHKPSWCHQQLPEGHVPLWALTAALHHPHGHRGSC